MVQLKYHPDEYDLRGQLRLPLLFWLVLLLQARTWLIFIMAGASRQQGDALLSLFYPDPQAFWLGLVLGIPALAALLLTGYRQRWPRVWQCWRSVLIVALLLASVSQAWQMQQVGLASPLPLLFTLFDLLCLWWLWRSPRLRDCFLPPDHHDE
ncbi:DUF2919 domain-containing protein [Pantoea sp. A4]|uniref:DUF2919 domain-containing protein n=1 Tax=Pantoea sp. A4 TaxID=1225184 RepID=UPI0004746D01|nr:DUF2919 domain-containing protein [Pantoea sp. A4]